MDTTEDAEDILQDVWYQFSDLMNTGAVEQTGAWLFRVARNRIIDKYRKHKPDSLDELIDQDLDEEFKPREVFVKDKSNPELEHLQNIFWEKLFEALDELPAAQKQVFILNELEDLSFEEISDLTGEKINTLLSRKRYAVLHLRKRLGQLYKEIIEH